MMAMNDKSSATMKRNHMTTAVKAVLATALVWGFSLGDTQAQSQQPYDIPSDMAVLPYQVDAVTQTIKEALESPVETNEYVQMVLTDPGFPQVTVGEPLDAPTIEAIEEWVAASPEAIEALLIAEKKNYDKYFNPATTGSTK